MNDFKNIVFVILVASSSLYASIDTTSKKVTWLQVDFPPAGIVIRRKDLNVFKQGGKTSFSTLISNKSLKFGSISNGQFGDTIDPIIKKYKKQSHLFFRQNTTNQLGNYKMLLADRLDYIVDFPFSYSKTLSNLSSKQKKSLVFLPITEEVKPQSLRSICGDTPASREFISKINSVLMKDEYKEAVIKSLIGYIPEALHKSYEKLNLSVIGK